jgi:gamma-glutamylcyclotransferase (GGCT)/AIG2-like uncharacterized protein YtfP
LTDAKAGDWIALYGSLMRGLGAMDEIGVGDRLRFVAPCKIAGQLYDLGAYPGLREGAGIVTGEIFAILDPKVIEVLDRFEDFFPDEPRESHYIRKRIPLIEPRSTTAWVYVYNHEPPQDRQVDAGDWRAHLARQASA